jgi:hypothetical protein
MVHIKQEGTKFHNPDEVFPKQFHHPKRSPMIRSGSTQSIPKDQKKTPNLPHHLTM